MWNYWAPNGVLQSHNPYLQTHGSRNPKVYFWHPISRTRAYFQSRISPRFCFKILNPELQWRENQDPEKPNGVHQTKPNIIIRCLAFHTDCVFYVYLCNGIKFLEISESEYAKSKDIIHSDKIFELSSIKTHHKLWLIFMINQTLRKGKYFSKIMNLKISKSEYLSVGKKKNSLEWSTVTISVKSAVN